MRNIKYYQLQHNNHKIIFAKEDQDYIFAGSYDHDLSELIAWFGSDNIEYFQGNKQEFEDAIVQFGEYSRGQRKVFSLPLSFEGTAFQKEVWTALTNIPYGSVVSYKDIASSINRPSATRAVASSIGKNPLLILIPCHRVIGSDGSLRGYRGGLSMKQELLTIENELKE